MKRSYQMQPAHPTSITDRGIVKRMSESQSHVCLDTSEVRCEGTAFSMPRDGLMAYVSTCLRYHALALLGEHITA